MARMPGTEWVGEQSPRTPMTRYDIVCVHTIVGFAPAHAAHFSTHGDGGIVQSRDTLYRSAANLNGNHRVIAIENEDHGSPFPTWGGSDVPSLSSGQVEACARILAWAHRTHGVPLQLCPDSRPGSRGLAYHRQGCDGNFTDGHRGRVPGGEVWSSSFGKVCPGRRRIDQLPAILTRARQIISPQEDPLMALTDAQADGLADDARSAAAGVARMEADLAGLIEAEKRRNATTKDRDKRLAGKIAAKVGATPEKVLEAIAEADAEGGTA